MHQDGELDGILQNPSSYCFCGVSDYRLCLTSVLNVDLLDLYNSQCVDPFSSTVSVVVVVIIVTVFLPTPIHKHINTTTMGLGVLEPRDRTKEVPGTVQLEGEDETTLRVTTNLKHGTGRHSDVVLAPQPSNSPNDPLSKPAGHNNKHVEKSR
jgi:hypothetical protein